MSALDRLFRLNPNSILGDRYRLDRCLGDGSYGFVWKAERLADHAVVAVKIPKAQGSRNRDLKEGEKLVGQPAHDNVVSVYWMGRVPPEKEVFAIEMEFFNSHTLAFLLDNRDERLVSSYGHVLDLFGQILDGVVHLHGLGVCHGDLKPQNILVGGGVAKLTDFGSSLTTEDLYARSRENGGTILYSPPEYAGISANTRRGWDARVAHDVYSLGVLLYQLLTGRLPHDTLAQVVRHSPFPSPREISTSIAPGLEAVALRALARNPEKRWGSVGELRTAFVRARAEQLAHQTQRPTVVVPAPTRDWSSEAVRLMDASSWRDAEAVAQAEYQRSRAPHALLFMVRAAVRDERYFRALEILDAAPIDKVGDDSVEAELETLALKALVHTQKVGPALDMVERCISRQGERPGLLLRKASLLGMQARFPEAAEVLVALNKAMPRQPAVLRRLAMVYEQLREFDRARAFRRAVARAEGGGATSR